MKDRSWHADGLCSGHPDPDLWHYSSSKVVDERELMEYQTAEAISICNQCPVKAQCLEQGLERENVIVPHYIDGSVWGGKMLGERLNIRDGRITHKYQQEMAYLRAVRKKLAKIYQ
jgi:hypothetical protein